MKKESERENAAQWCYEPLAATRVEAMAREHGVPLAVAEVLCRRGIDDVESFLYPSLARLPGPDGMAGVHQGAELLRQAIARGRTIAIYGDYDVDGMTAAAVIAAFLRQVGVTPLVYQPDRFRHGYGLHPSLVEEIAGRAGERGGVLVTVDCGISDHEAVRRARQLGLDVIVTDHHLPPATLPEATVLINPLLPACEFPEKHLAGVGVAFYLVAALRSQIRTHLPSASEPNLRELLDLVAIGTIADMVPLTGVNRIFTRVGLEVLRTSRRPGLQALKEICGLGDGRTVHADDIAFRIGPRLNAAGRMGQAADGFLLLTTTDHQQARRLARKLDAQNQLRKQTTEELVEAARQQVDDKWPALVVGGRQWHRGVIGIVASRLLDEFHRPVIVYSLDDEEGGLARASGRSVKGFHLYRALASCADLLEGYGGHELAAGLTIDADNLETFRRRFGELAAAAGLAPRPVVHIDILTDGRQLFSSDFLRGYRLLAPFGIGNPEPVFTARNCRLGNVRVLKERHLRFDWQTGTAKLPCIAFGMGALQPLASRRAIDLLFYLRPGYYQGMEQWQVHVSDIKESASS